MKKLLLLLLSIPLIGSGQACQYGSSTDATKLCDFYKSRSFATYRNADIALDKILDVTGMSKRFVLKECNDISNCLATNFKGIRYILYDRDFMDAIATRTNSWSSTSILAHEVGHHVNGHTLGTEETLAGSRQMELEADEYSGFIMYKLGASLDEAQEAISLISSNKNDSFSTHPSKDKRLRAIKIGYNKAKIQGSKNDYIVSNLTAEDYFYKSYNNQSDWQYQIDNYTNCLRIDPYYDAYAYYNRGVAYGNLEKNEDALSDYTRALRIDPSHFLSYYNRANIYHNKGMYEEAINDLIQAIKINSDDADSYYNRGVAYGKLKKYKKAIKDYTRALIINPDLVKAYNNRGTAKYRIGLDGCSDLIEAKKRGHSISHDVYKIICK